MASDKPDGTLFAVGLRAFFRLAEEWGVSETEQRILLGASSASALKDWRHGEIASADGATLERISYLIGIYKAIHTILVVPTRANDWIRAANSASLFGGQSALDRMLSGDIRDLRLVRGYLDAQLL